MLVHGRFRYSPRMELGILDEMLFFMYFLKKSCREIIECRNEIRSAKNPGGVFIAEKRWNDSQVRRLERRPRFTRLIFRPVVRLPPPIRRGLHDSKVTDGETSKTTSKAKPKKAKGIAVEKAKIAEALADETGLKRRAVKPVPPTFGSGSNRATSLLSTKFAGSKKNNKVLQAQKAQRKAEWEETLRLRGGSSTTPRDTVLIISAAPKSFYPQNLAEPVFPYYDSQVAATGQHTVSNKCPACGLTSQQTARLEPDDYFVCRRWRKVGRKKAVGFPSEKTHIGSPYHLGYVDVMWDCLTGERFVR